MRSISENYLVLKTLLASNMFYYLRFYSYSLLDPTNIFFIFRLDIVAKLIVGLFPTQHHHFQHALGNWQIDPLGPRNSTVEEPLS